MSEFRETMLEVLGAGHSIRFHATGDSMHPTLCEGDALTASPVRASELRRGDIIVTLQPRGVTVHRLITINGQRVITRGDNADVDDDAVPVDAVVARVTAIERDGATIRIGTPWPARMRRVWLRITGRA